MYLLGGTICFAVVLFWFLSGLLKRTFENKIKVDNRLRLSLREDFYGDDRVDKKEKSNELRFLKKMMFFVSNNYIERLEDHLLMAGIALKAEEYLAIWILAVTAIPSLIIFFDGSLVVSMGFAILGAMLPPLILTLYTKKRRSLFHSQLADGLTVMCNSLKTGFSLQVALKSVADEMADPIGKEFARAVRETQLGMSLEDSLARMVRRTQCEDLELFATTINIQKQTGGNLSEILDNISKTIMERIALVNEIKLLTTTGRTSGYVIGLLPVFLLVGLMILNPEYVSMFFETQAGKTMLAIAAGMEIIGFLLVRKVMNIKY